MTNTGSHTFNALLRAIRYVCSAVGWLAGWLVGCLVGRSAGRLVDWLVGLLVD